MSLKSALRTAQRQQRSTRRNAILPAATPSLQQHSEPKPLTIRGPYKNRDKWRLVLMDETGRKSVVLASCDEAEALKASLMKSVQARASKTVGESLDEYRDYSIQYRSVKPTSAEEHCRHLRDLLPSDAPLASITTEKANRFYLAYAQRPNKRNGRPLSPNTHHWVLLIAKCWGKWCVKNGIMSANPFASIEPIGRLNAGKKQLRLDEAQRLNRYLVERAKTGDTAAVGVLLMLHLGLRQGEVSARVVRDVDGEGRILHIPFGKTASSRRRLRIPEWLRPLMLSIISGKAPEQLLFSQGNRLRSRGYWWRKVHEYCQQAGVPLVCPHSLRGLHATLAIEEGTTSDAVARALGHTSFAMTAKHYASADSVANARLTRASQALNPSGQNQMPSDRDSLSALLHSLTPEQLNRSPLQTRSSADGPAGPWLKSSLAVGGELGGFSGHSARLDVLAPACFVPI